MRRPFKLTAFVLTILLALPIPYPAIAYVSAHTVGADLCVCPGLCLHAITRADTQVCPGLCLHAITRADTQVCPGLCLHAITRADTQVCPGLCLHAITRADTQVCPYVVLQTALSGQWAGAIAAGSMSGTLEIAISLEGGVWAASIKMDMGGRQASSQASDLNVTETGLSFTMEFAGANVRFTGKVAGEKISGVLEAIAGGRVVGAGSWTVTRTSTPQPAPENT